MYKTNFLQEQPRTEKLASVLVRSTQYVYSKHSSELQEWQALGWKDLATTLRSVFLSFLCKELKILAWKLQALITTGKPSLQYTNQFVLWEQILTGLQYFQSTGTHQSYSQALKAQWFLVAVNCNTHCLTPPNAVLPI